MRTHQGRLHSIQLIIIIIMNRKKSYQVCLGKHKGTDTSAQYRTQWPKVKFIFQPESKSLPPSIIIIIEY